MNRHRGFQEGTLRTFKPRWMKKEEISPYKLRKNTVIKTFSSFWDENGKEKIIRSDPKFIMRWNDESKFHIEGVGMGDNQHELIDLGTGVGWLEELSSSVRGEIITFNTRGIRKKWRIKWQSNVQFLQQLQPEWSRFVTIVKQQHKLDEVSYHKLFDILKQYQKEVNKLRAERMAKNANPLALVATAQTLQDSYYQTSKSHKSYAPTSKASLPSRSHATTRYKGKEIACDNRGLSRLVKA
ncbi:hypothetical protein Tco_0389702 [Tanacetum coccineum]